MSFDICRDISCFFCGQIWNNIKRLFLFDWKCWANSIKHCPLAVFFKSDLDTTFHFTEKRKRASGLWFAILHYSIHYLRFYGCWRPFVMQNLFSNWTPAGIIYGHLKVCVAGRLGSITFTNLFVRGQPLHVHTCTTMCTLTINKL